MKNLLVPQIVVSVLVGLTGGVGAYTFLYAKGGSYLSNNPAACANCHIMTEHFEGWLKSTHRAVAVCNDCHTPQGLIGKYTTKATNGFWHSFAFTTGRFPEPLRIKPGNLQVTENACRKCHEDIVEHMTGEEPSGASPSCVRCHASVGHMR